MLKEASINNDKEKKIEIFMILLKYLKKIWSFD